jgi:hypothetical protein
LFAHQDAGLFAVAAAADHVGGEHGLDVAQDRAELAGHEAVDLVLGFGDDVVGDAALAGAGAGAELLQQAADAVLQGGADQRGRRVALEHDREGGLLADGHDHHACAAEGDQQLFDRRADGRRGDDHAAHGLGDVGRGGVVEGAALAGLIGAIDGGDQRAAHAREPVELLEQRD